MPEAGDVTNRTAVPIAGRRLRHRIEGGLSNCIVGWVCDAAEPDRALSVRIVVERRDQPPHDLGVLQADDPCHLEDIGGRQVACGFVYRLPVQSDAAKIRAFEVATNTELNGSPIHLGAVPYFEGFLEAVADGELVGWAWANRPDYHCDVDVYIDGQYIDTVFAILPRSDLPAHLGPRSRLPPQDP